MRKSFNDFTGWLNLLPTTLKANKDFTVATNVFYNSAKQIQTRRWYREYGNAIDANPITSYFFYQRDDTLERIAICFSGSNAWKYDESTEDWNSIRTGRIEYETIPALSANRTRWDFAVYKNIVYMCNWVNNYASFDWTTWSTLGQWPAKSWGSFDHTTDRFLLWGYPLTDWDEVMFSTSWTLPTGITAIPGSTNTSIWYYVVNTVSTTSIQLSMSPWWDPITFSSNWTGTFEYYELEIPRFRYLQYLSDRIYGAGDYNAPTTLYYSNALPTNGSSINANAIIVWWDERGSITGMEEYSQSVLTFKDSKIYAVDVANTNIQTVDTEWWGWSDRSIQSVANSLVYLSDRWIETFTKRDWTSWVGAIDNRPLSDKIRVAFDSISEWNRYATVWRYIRDTNNYYCCIDTNDDNIPDTWYVYSSLTWGRTKYTLPLTYDLWDYIDNNNERQYLFASGSWGQMYRYEYWFDDDGQEIEAELITREIDFWDTGAEYTFDYVDVTGWKEIGNDIDITVYVEWVAVGIWSVTDANLNMWLSQGIAVDTVGENALNVDPEDPQTWILVYKYTVRVNFFARWPSIQLKLASSWVQWIYERMTVSVNGEPQEVFAFNSYA